MIGLIPHTVIAWEEAWIIHPTLAPVHLKHPKGEKNEPHHLSHCWSDRRLYCQ